MEDSDRLNVELTVHDWRLIEFLARRGLVSEVHAFVNGQAHEHECVKEFSAAHLELIKALPKEGVIQALCPAPEPRENSQQP